MNTIGRVARRKRSIDQLEESVTFLSLSRRSVVCVCLWVCVLLLSFGCSSQSDHSKDACLKKRKERSKEEEEEEEHERRGRPLKIEYASCCYFFVIWYGVFVLLSFRVAVLFLISFLTTPSKQTHKRCMAREEWYLFFFSFFLCVYYLNSYFATIWR